MSMNLMEELQLLTGGSVNDTVFSAIESGVRLKPFSFEISREQTKFILENVPNIFPENMARGKYSRIPYRQQRGCKRVSELGGKEIVCPVPVIAEVIRIAVDIKESLRKEIEGAPKTPSVVFKEDVPMFV